MSGALQVASTNTLLWEDNTKIDEIRKLFAPNLTEMEFGYFVGLGRATKLNPFTREIWAVKYDKSAPAQVFIGRDGYRKAAQAHSEYDYHQCDAVYENDKFEISQGEVSHTYTLTNRGKLIGAYCVSKRHKSSRPIYVFAEIGEYSTGRSVWKDKPATMIKKVAESQCLRACFQDLLGGTYGEEEIQPTENPKPNKAQSLMDKINAAKGKTIDMEAIVEPANLANPEQLKEAHALMAVKVFDPERLKAALEHYKVDTIGQLSESQADDFISKLNRLPDKE